ncbi:uncharacterized protein LOC133204356 [Saccostrea echinata]|uniref:uncharacterized protein LOC133204356 n=1 Tax=Saccostrea echinata TaxID=191078 RepID=UPI002A838D1E|nr:uncharacterized protein LOC133204356 [Saccostrea echinata]
MSATHSLLTDLKSENNPITVVCTNTSLLEDIYHLKQQLSQETLIRLVHPMSVFVNEMLTVKKDMTSVLVKMELIEKSNANIKLENQRMRLELDQHIKMNNSEGETLQENIQLHNGLRSTVEEIFRNYTVEFKTEEIVQVKKDMSEALGKIQELENNVTDLRREKQRLQEELDQHIMGKEKDGNTKLQVIKELQKDVRNVTSTVESFRVDARLHPAFHARLSHSVRKIGFYQTVIFDFEVVDTTNSYDPRSGIFTAPLTGTYVFYWNILSNEASGMDTTLDCSQGSLGYGFVSHAVNYGNGGNLVIANLTSGTHVWVKKADRYGNYMNERFSTFSG